MSAATITPAQHPPSAAARVAPPPARAIRWAIARAEGRRLLRHPVFLLGMALSVVTLALATGRLPFGASDYSETPSMLAGDCFVMLGAACWTFLAAFLAASRERRDGARDFYAAQPTTARLRTEAALLSLAWAGLAGAALIAVGTLALVGLDGALITDVNLNGPAVDENRRFSVRALELLQGPLYLVVAGACGVLLASWTRHVYAALFGALMLFLPPIGLLPWLLFDDGMGGYLGAIHTRAGAGGVAPIAWQLLGLAAVAAAAGAGALARHDRRFVVVVVAVLGVALLALGLPTGPQAAPLPGQPPLPGP